MIKLYSTSPNKECAEKIMNKFVLEYPEHEKFIQMLAEYPVQKWAREIRKKINLDTQTIDEAILEDTNFFGIDINTEVTLESHRKSLQVTDDIIDIFDYKLNHIRLKRIHKEIINDIFFGEQATTAYYVKKELPNLLETLCDRFENDVLKRMKKIESIYNNVDEEMIIAFHDAELLYKIVKTFNYHQRRMSNVDRRDVYSIVKEIIFETKHYRFLDEIYTPLNLMFEGSNIHQVCLKMGKHNDYVKRRYIEGIECLNIIIWGYSKA